MNTCYSESKRLCTGRKGAVDVDNNQLGKLTDTFLIESNLQGSFDIYTYNITNLNHSVLFPNAATLSNNCTFQLENLSLCDLSISNFIGGYHNVMPRINQT